MTDTQVRRSDAALTDPSVAGSVQPRSQRRDRWTTGLWCVLVLGAALRFGTALLPEHLLIRVTVDDALYYTGVARHVGAGQGFAFDGVHATNGFHPLWALVITPLTWVLEGTALLRAMAVVQALLATATFVLLARLLRPLLGTFATTVGLAVWWLSAHSVLHGQSGVEASLATCCVALLIVAAVTYDQRPSARLATWVGVAAGACYLARSDAAFAVMAIGVWLLVRQLRSGRTANAVLRHAAIAAGVGLGVVAPWLTWNLARFGTISQDSFWARPQVGWERSVGRPVPSPGQVLGTAVDYLSGMWLLESGWPPVLVGAAALSAVMVVARAGFAHGPPRTLAALGGCLVSAGVALAVVHGGVRMLARGYYYEWLRMSLGLLTAAVIAGIVAGPARAVVARRLGDDGIHRLAVAVLAAVIVLGTALGVRGLADPGYPWQGHILAAGRWLDEHTHEDDVVLSFNAGILGEYSRRRVVNLDGVINHTSAEALADRRLSDHMCDTDASWFVDFAPVVLEEYAPYLGDGSRRITLEEVATIEDPSAAPYGRSAMTVFRFSCDD